MIQKKKRNSALVFNPAGRTLSIAGVRRNPRRKNRTSTRHHHVRRATTTRRRNPRRIRSNPANISGLLVTALMAGIGVSLFDVVTTQLVPQSSSVIRAGVKLGGAWLFQSAVGSKVPLLGKYKNDIALVLAVAGVVDLMKLYVLPAATQFVGAAGFLPPANMVQIPASDDTTAGLYGAANYSAAYN